MARCTSVTLPPCFRTALPSAVAGVGEAVVGGDEQERMVRQRRSVVHKIPVWGFDCGFVGEGGGAGASEAFHVVGHEAGEFAFAA